MKINKQGNVYTVAYIVLLVIVVGALLAITSLSLKNKQQANADADRMRQILMAIKVVAPEDTKVNDLFAKYVTEQLVVNSKGEVIGNDAFAISPAAEVKKPADKRALPIFICTLPDGEKKYVLPVYGAGLWGPIWGYIALDADGSTIYGAYFAHQGETPGLGAEIEKPKFSDQFCGKHMWKDGHYLPVTVVKAGQKPTGDEDYVDGVSGGTITSKGVAAMINESLTPYEAYLKTLQNS